MNTQQEQLEVNRVYQAANYIVKSEHKDRSAMQRMMVKTWDGMDSHREGFCRICNSDLGDDFKFTIPIFCERPVELIANVCDICVLLVDDHYGDGVKKAKVESEMSPKWDELCPLKFKAIVESFDPTGSKIDVPSYEIVSQWIYSRKGMYITGDSGLGKTAALWNLFRRLERQTGKAPKFIKATHLARQLARAAKDSEDNPIKWLSRYKVLIIDDLGKEKITTSFSAQLFDVIDARYENHRPTIITTKFGGKALMQRFTEKGDDSTGNDIVRRLADSCKSVHFDGK